jgi:hypothetical protein
VHCYHVACGIQQYYCKLSLLKVENDPHMWFFLR